MKYSKKLLNQWINLEKRYIPKDAWGDDPLTLWRERVMFFLYFFAALTGPIALIPSLYLSYKEKLINVFLMDFFSYFSVIFVIILYRKLSLNQKTWIAFSIFYLLGTGLLFALGFYGAGYVWLFGAAVIVGAMIGIKAANFALFINFLTLIIIAFYIKFGHPQWATGLENTLHKWVVMIANFILSNILVTYIVAIILNSLKIALAREQSTAGDIREMQEELMAILKASPDPVLVYDKEYYVQYLNDAFASTFGWSLSEVKGKEIDFIPDGEKVITFDSFKNNEESEIRFETKRYTKKGSELYISLSAAPIKGDSGDMVGIVVNFKDITEIKRMEQDLQQAQKMESIGRLAGGIAHDFNNILFPILGNTEMLLQDADEENNNRGRLEKIYSACLRARDLVKQILTFSRQESNEPVLMKMQPVVKEALNLLRASISRTIEIKRDIQNNCGFIEADPTQIHQVVMNLATNAYHAMEETGGELSVGLNEVDVNEFDLNLFDINPGKYVCLTVSDTGQGMEKALTQKIFDPFFTTKQVGKGTGMGLSVVHGIVKKMNGAIRVYSEPGVGTRFYVYLPVVKSNLIEENKAPTEQDFKFGSERVLVVDDEKEILEMEVKMLEYLGYEVTSFSSSIDALEVFNKTPEDFDIVITDMAMPKMSGDRLSAAIKDIAPDIPILLCTGFSETMTKEKAFSIGIRGFLLKPVNLKEFSHKVRELLDNRPD